MVSRRIHFKQLSWFAMPLLLGLLLLGACTADGEEEVLDLNLGSEPATLDPALATDNVSIDLARALFVGLTNIDEETGEVIPDLATTWDASPDGTTYTFHLRKDVRWTDGTEVTAEDAEYGILRTLNPDTASLYSYVLSAIIKDAQDYNSGNVADPDIVGVEATGAYTLQITLEHPASWFPSIAAMWVMFPQPRQAIEAHGDKWIEPGNIVTNGPYKVASWQHGSRLILEKNPDYYDAKNTDIDKIDFVMVQEASTAMALYEAGDLDSLYGTGVPQVDIDRVKANSVLSKEFFTGPRLITYFYGFNNSKPPMDNPLVRKAFTAAIDRQTLIDTITKGGQRPATTFTAPGVFGAVDPDEGIGIPFDPTQAKEYLTQAGYPGGEGLPEITLLYNTSEGNEKIAVAIQAMWIEHLGITVNLVSQEFRVYLDTLQTDAPHIYRRAWGADYPDANNWLNEVFHSTSGNNYANFSNARFDQLVEAAAREQDPAVRLELYKEAETIL